MVKCQKCNEEFTPKPKKPRVCEACIKTDKVIGEGLKAFMAQPEIVQLRAGIQSAVEVAYKRTFGV